MPSPRTPPLNTLRAFETAARHGSFVRAATELHLTAAAISHRIKELESALGIALFKRKARGVELTAAGQRYRDSIASAFQIIEQATSTIDQITVDGPLTVSVPESFAQFWLAPRLSRLTQQFAGLELTVTGESQLVDLRDGQADIGLRFGTGSYPGLAVEYVIGDAVTVLAPAGFYSTQADASAKTLLAENTLLEDYRTTPNEPWMGWPPWLREAGLHSQTKRRKLRFSNSGLALLACREEAGICIGRMSLAYDLLRQRQLRPLFPWRSTEFSYHFVTRPADQQNPRVMAFRSWLYEEMAAYCQDVYRTVGVQLKHPGM